MMTHILSLEHICSPDGLGVHRLETGREVFADGASTGASIDWALRSAALCSEPSRIAGFWCFENPQAKPLAEIAERHDFLLVRDRWIVDGWLCHVGALATQAIYDLTDPDDEGPIRSIYGDRTAWEISDQQGPRDIPLFHPETAGTGL